MQRRFIEAAFVAVCCLVLTSSCGDAEQIARDHRARAMALMASGDFELARVEAANLLRLDPQNVGDLVLAATIARAQGNVRRAAALLLTAHDVDDTHIDTRVALAQLRVLARQYDEASLLLEPVLQTLPDHPHALALRAAIGLATGDDASARADLARSLALDPANSVALPMQTALVSAEQGPAAAASLLETALALSPERQDLRTLLVRVYLDNEDFASAADVLGQMIDAGDDRESVRRHRAALLLKAGAAEEGERVLRDGVADGDSDSSLRLALVEFLAADGRADQAMDTLQSYISADPKAYDLRLARARMLAEAGLRDEARQAYRSILTSRPPLNWRTEAVVALAGFERDLGESDRALATVDEFLASESNSAAALAVRARLRLEAGDVEGAIGDLHAALASDRENGQMRYDLAQLHNAQGDYVLAEVQLRQALEMAPGFDKARLALIKLHLERGSLYDAKREVETLLARVPSSVDALSLAFDVARRDEDWALAESYAQRITTLHPDRSLGPFLASITHIARADVERAEVNLARALAIDPLAREPLTALIRLFLDQGRTADARRRLDDTLRLDPSQPTALQWRAQMFLAANEPMQAVQLFEQALAEQPDAVEAWRGLAASQLRTGNRAAARTALERGIAAVDVAPQEQLSVDLTLLHLSNDDALAAVAEAERYLRANPLSHVTMNNLAMLLVEHEPYENSLARARVLVEALVPSGNEDFVDTYALVMTRTNNTPAAIAAIDEFLKREKPSAKLRYRRGVALAEQGDHEAAQRELRAALRTAPASAFAEDARERLRGLP